MDYGCGNDNRAHHDARPLRAARPRERGSNRITERGSTRITLNSTGRGLRRIVLEKEGAAQRNRHDYSVPSASSVVNIRQSIDPRRIVQGVI
jgi:hypothetical protein